MKSKRRPMISTINQSRIQKTDEKKIILDLDTSSEEIKKDTRKNNTGSQRLSEAQKHQSAYDLHGSGGGVVSYVHLMHP